jgi:hypothetical protein
MRILKTNVLLRLFNSYLVDSPQPANISYLWNFGSLLGLCLILQILTGVFLAMKIKYTYFSVDWTDWAQTLGLLPTKLWTVIIIGALPNLN